MDSEPKDLARPGPTECNWRVFLRAGEAMYWPLEGSMKAGEAMCGLFGPQNTFRGLLWKKIVASRFWPAEGILSVGEAA